MKEAQTLTAERWGRFGFDQQILMIANEMHRSLSSMDPAHRPSMHLPTSARCTCRA